MVRGRHQPVQKFGQVAAHLGVGQQRIQRAADTRRGPVRKAALGVGEAHVVVAVGGGEPPGPAAGLAGVEDGDGGLFLDGGERCGNALSGFLIYQAGLPFVLF